MEKYSVLMSVYYKENPIYFDKSIKSMVNQLLRPSEVIIVEDGELTPELYSVIDKYKKKYQNLFTILKLEKNMGLGIALREGVKISKYNIIARMDTDDISRKFRCKKQMKYLMKNPDCAIVGGQIEEFIDNPNNVIGKRIVPLLDKEIKEYLKIRCPFNHMTVMFRKDDVLNSGNYENFPWNEDYYLWIKMTLNNKKFGNLKDTLVDVRVGKDMYQRRGGIKYFNSEKRIQKIMLENGLINKKLFLLNIFKRFIIQVLLTNRIRGYIFKKFAREKDK